MMEIDKAIETHNPNIVKIFVIFLENWVHSFLGLNAQKIDDQNGPNLFILKSQILI